jgi:apolipoprotein D and lipocalin family protein
MHFDGSKSANMRGVLEMIHTNPMLPVLMGILAAASGLAAAAADTIPPLQTVSQVDLNRYMGTWYEIASFPQWFQKGCVASTATYTLRKDGDVDVLNQCREKTLDGKPKDAKGKAWVVDPKSKAKLKVRFFWPFSGDYWIIDLGPEYQYAVVGHPKRNYLWILSRSRRMDPAVYDGIIERLKNQHYDVTRLNKTLQPAE